MATIVTGELYEKIDGKLVEIKRQLRQKGGYPFDPLKLDRLLQLLVEGKFDALSKFPCEIYARELIPQGWTVLEDVEPTANLDVAKLRFVSYLNGGESYIVGDEMRKRAVMLGGNLGLSDAPRILAEQAKLSVDRNCYILLPGTKLRRAGGNLFVPYLFWFGGRLILYFFWLGHYFYDGGRLALSE